MNVPVNGHSVHTLQLLGELPRGKRFGEDELLAAAKRIGMSLPSARRRLNALIESGRVRERALLDSQGRPLGGEWEVS